MITVLAPGVLSLVQDLGRPGCAHLGVAPSGAWDRDAHCSANALVGNAPDAATIEILHGGLELRTSQVVFVALVGHGVRLWLGDLHLATGSRHAVPAGGRIRIEGMGGGLRSYLAIAGGIDVPATLGSRSRDTLAQLGPPPLKAGDVLPIGQSRCIDQAGSGAPSLSPQAPITSPHEPHEPFDVLPAPLEGQAWDGVINAVETGAWRVSEHSDRVGVRLLGESLIGAHIMVPEVAVQALVPGAIQLPGSGQPIIFGPDHPLTGGYPVIGVLGQSALQRLAQLRAGDDVRLRWLP